MSEDDGRKIESQETGEDTKYVDLIAESKKYRKRAQEAEEKTAQFEAAEKERLDKEALARGEHEKVITELQSKNKELEVLVKDLKPRAERADNFVTAQKELMLMKLPEDQREIYKEMSLEGLANHIELVEKTKPGADTSRPGTAHEKGFESPLEVLQAVKEGKITRAEGETLIKTFTR